MDISLLPHLGYCACIFLNYGILWIYAKDEIAGSYGSSVFNLRKLNTDIHSDYTNLHHHQQCIRVPCSPHPFQHLLICRLFDHGHSDWCEMILHSSDFICLIISDIEHIFTWLLAICMSSLEKCLLKSYF